MISISAQRSSLIAYYSARISLALIYRFLRLFGFTFVDLNSLFGLASVQREPLDTCLFRFLLSKYCLTLVDYGANHGEFSRAALPSLRSPAILIDANAVILERTELALNRLGFTSLAFHSGVVGFESSETLYLCAPLGHSGAAFVTDRLENVDCSIHKVLTSQSLAPSHYLLEGISYAAKIDLEGSEPLLLAQLVEKSWLSSFSLIACEGSSSDQVLQIYEMLSDKNYILYALDDIWLTGHSLRSQLYRCLRCLVNPHFRFHSVSLEDVLAGLPSSMIYFVSPRLEHSLHPCNSIMIESRDLWGRLHRKNV